VLVVSKRHMALAKKEQACAQQAACPIAMQGSCLLVSTAEQIPVREKHNAG
jgi:hypothetical protein